jgi:hypothetical protein
VESVLSADLSNKKDHQKSKHASIALATNDTPGPYCPGRLDSQTIFPGSEQVYEAFYKSFEL